MDILEKVIRTELNEIVIGGYGGDGHSTNSPEVCRPGESVSARLEAFSGHTSISLLGPRLTSRRQVKLLQCSKVHISIETSVALIKMSVVTSGYCTLLKID